MALTATEEELEELRKKILSGDQSIEADGRKVVFRPLDDQLRVLGEAQASASASSGTSKRRRYAVHRSGW